MTNDPLNTVIGDLQYLVDELEALKYLIDVVPVYERPGDELSVCEHIRLIHYVQDHITDNLSKQSIEDKFSSNLEYFVKEYKNRRSDIQIEQKKGVQHYIDKLIHARVGLLGSYNERIDEIDASELNALNHLIKLERTIFKEMAEKVLAINKET